MLKSKSYLPCFYPLLSRQTPGIPDHHWTGAHRSGALLSGLLSCRLGRYWRPSCLSRLSYGCKWMVYMWQRPGCRWYRQSAQPELWSRSPALLYGDQATISRLRLVMSWVLVLPMWDKQMFIFHEDIFQQLVLKKHRIIFPCDIISRHFGLRNNIKIKTLTTQPIVTHQMGTPLTAYDIMSS